MSIKNAILHHVINTTATSSPNGRLIVLEIHSPANSIRRVKPVNKSQLSSISTRKSTSAIHRDAMIRYVGFSDTHTRNRVL